MKLNTKNLRSALARVGMACNTRTTLPASACVKISTTDGWAQLECTNLNSWITRKVEAEGALEKPVLVSFAKLSGLLANVVEEAVELNIEGAKLQLKAGKKERAIGTMDPDEFPCAPTDEGEPLVVNMKDLADGIEAVGWCAAKNSLMDLWKLCVTVHLTDTKLACFASTGVRMALFERASICTPATVMLPAEMSALLMQDMREEGAHAATTPNMFFVRNPLGGCVVKLTEAQPVDFRQITNLRLGQTGTVMDAEMIMRSCLDARTLDGTGGKMAAIDMVRKGDKVAITLVGVDDQGSEEVTAPGDALDLRLPADQVHASLSQASTKTVVVVTLPNAAFMESGEVLFGFSQMRK